MCLEYQCLVRDKKRGSKIDFVSEVQKVSANLHEVVTASVIISLFYINPLKTRALLQNHSPHPIIRRSLHGRLHLLTEVSIARRLVSCSCRPPT